MKLLLSLLFSLAFSISSFSQNGVYLYGFLENAPETPVQIDVAIYGDSSMTQVILFTEPSGNIQTQWFDLPSGEIIQFIGAGFYNCLGNYTFESWNASEFDNLIDIPINLNYCADSTVIGCTDPLALNYNPQATEDDGSCEYTTTCDLNDVTINISTQSWGQEITWNLVHDSISVAGEGNYQSYNSYSSNWCLENGCYVFEMFDTFGDGWNGSTFQIMVAGVIVQTGTLQSGGYGSVSFGINQEGCFETPPVSGCTDPLAINYNPFATIDNNSCEYATAAENDLCANATPLILGSTILINNSYAFQNEGIWGECWGFGQGEGEQTSVWYTFTTPDYPASIHLEALYDGTNTLTDTQFGIFETCGGPMIYCDGNGGEGLMSALDFECGELAENATYILMIDGWNGDSGTCFLQYEVDSACAVTVLGCTDPFAINYNPLATVNDGSCMYETECTEVTIMLNGNTDLPADWLLFSNNGFFAGGTFPGGNYSVSDCLEDGCYTIEIGTNDSIYSVDYTVVVDSQIIAIGVINNYQPGIFSIGAGCDSTNVIYGCTDPDAINYNPEATIDNGTCEYVMDCDFNQISIIISTQSWGNEIYWNLLNADSIPVASGNGYSSNTENVSQWCLADGCYTFEMFDTYGDGWNGGSFEVIMNDTTLASGTLNSGSYGSINFGINQDGCVESPVIYGCTDPEAINYNPDATENDGSCIYQFECSIDFLVIPDSTGEDVIWIMPTENILAAVSVLWDFGDGTTSTDLFPSHEYIGDGPFTLCLTATFASPDGSTCSITYCAVLTGDMVGGSGFTQSEGGFTINVIGAGSTVGLTAAESITNLSLWPNPTSNQLNIRFNSLNSTAQSLEIMDITGKIIIEKKLTIAGGLTTEILDLSSLNSGVYLFKLSNKDQVETRRFVIAK